MLAFTGAFFGSFLVGPVWGIPLFFFIREKRVPVLAIIISLVICYWFNNPYYGMIAFFLLG